MRAAERRAMWLARRTRILYARFLNPIIFST